MAAPHHEHDHEDVTMQSLERGFVVPADRPTEGDERRRDQTAAPPYAYVANMRGGRRADPARMAVR